MNVDFSDHARNGDVGLLVEPVGEPVEDSILGWPIKVSAFLHPRWTPLVMVTRPPTPDLEGDPDHTFDLTAEDAITLALQLVAVAQELRGAEHAKQILLGRNPFEQ